MKQLVKWLTFSVSMALTSSCVDSQKNEPLVTEPRTIAKSLPQTIAGKKAAVEFLQFPHGNRRLRVVVETLLTNTPSELSVVAYSSTGKVLPTAFITSMAGSETGPTTAYYSVTLPAADKLSYVNVQLNNETRRFELIAQK